MAAFAADLPGIAVGATRAAFTGLPTNDVFVGLIQRGMCQEVILSPTLWDAFAQFDDEGCAPDPTPADLDPDAPETARDRYFAYVGSIAAYAFCWRYAERLVAGQDAPLLRDVPPPDAARVSAAAAAIETAQAGPGRSDQLAFAAVRAAVAAARLEPPAVPPPAVRERAAWLGIALADVVCDDGPRQRAT